MVFFFYLEIVLVWFFAKFVLWFSEYFSWLARWLELANFLLQTKHNLTLFFSTLISSLNFISSFPSSSSSLLLRLPSFLSSSSLLLPSSSFSAKYFSMGLWRWCWREDQEEVKEGEGVIFGLRDEGVSLPRFFESFALVGRGRSSSAGSSIRKMSSKKFGIFIERRGYLLDWRGMIVSFGIWRDIFLN